MNPPGTNHPVPDAARSPMRGRADRDQPGLPRPGKDAGRADAGTGLLARDDFAGIVRLLDTIMSDKVILDRLKERGKGCKGVADVADAVATGDEEVAAE
jgi:hypothetical protein